MTVVRKWTHIISTFRPAAKTGKAVCHLLRRFFLAYFDHQANNQHAL